MVRLAQHARASMVLRARGDAAAFNDFVLKDEQTGVGVLLAPMHRLWHDLADKHDRLNIIAHVESAKTQNLSVGRVLWALGRDPNTRVVIVSNTAAQSQKIVRSIAGYLERSRELREVFPDLKPAAAGPWTNTQLTVERKGAPKDPSVQATGVHGSIVGARIDLLILDDLLDYENARTPHGREDLWDWVHSTLFGRLTADARVISVGNAYHRDDFLHRIATNPLWRTVKFPVISDEGVPSWPERWPLERISKKRDELGPLEFARQMLCQARDDAEARFKREWIDLALQRGNGRNLQHALAVIPSGCSVYTGVDLAVQQHSGADLTAFVTILVHPDGTREILNVESARLAGPEIVQRIQQLHHRYQGIFFVENNGAQEFLLQFLRGSAAIPVRPFTTGRNKVHPEFGVESLAAEMASGKWVIPNRDGRMHAEVDALVNEMLYYDPRSHTGDRLMACLPPGEQVTTARGIVAIEDVREGDLVLTHKGRFRKVTGLESRPYSGDLVVVKPSGMLPVRVTREHPIWAAGGKFLRDGTNRLVPDRWEWLDAADLKAGRKLDGMFALAPTASGWAEKAAPVIDLAPLTQERERKQAWGARWHVTGDTLRWGAAAPIARFIDVDERVALLLGLFLAEGTAHHHQASFALHERETHLAAFVIEQAQRLFGATCAVDRRHDSKGVAVRINSTLAARFFRQLGKQEGKGLPWAWMGWPLALRLAVVRGWFMGDGHLRVNASGKLGLSAVSVAPAIIRQAQLALNEAGLVTTVAPFKQSGLFQGKPCTQRPAWRLQLSWADTARLLGARLPVEQAHWADLPMPRERTNSRAVPVDGGMAVRLASVEREPYHGPVFNLHVEEDESFVAGGIAVHNCWFSREAARQGNIRAEVGYMPTLRR